MADRKTHPRGTGVASGFPRPDDVPGPTDRLRRLHPGEDLEARDPAFGRVPAEQAATDDHVPLDDMVSPQGRAAEATMRSMAGLADRVAELTADRVRAELAMHAIPARARAVGIGIGELGAAGALAAAAGAATLTAAVAGLSRVMPLWAAALTTAGALGSAGAVLAWAGGRTLRAPLAGAPTD